MNEAQNSEVQSSEVQDPERAESEEPAQERWSELADRMAESLLAEQPGEQAWDRQFPASCGKGWG